MSTITHALQTLLTYQLHALHQERASLEQQCMDIDQNIRSTLQKILTSCIMPALILPEQEIARSHFVHNQQQKQHELQAHKIQLEAQQNILKTKQIQLNTSLKMLEKKRNVGFKNAQAQLQSAQQKDMDEWIILRRT